MDLNNAKAVILIFILPDCPACHDYMPRFKRIATEYYNKGVHCPIVTYDLSSEDNITQAVADRFNIEVTPTTIVAKRGSGSWKIEGGIEDEEIHQMFQTVARICKG